MTADHDPQDPATGPGQDLGDDRAAGRLRASLDAVTATTPVHPDWDDVVVRAEGCGPLASTVGRRSWTSRRPALLAAAVVAVLGLAAVVAVTLSGRPADDGRTLRSDDGTQAPGGPDGLAAGDRYAVVPLPAGWSVLSVTNGLAELPATCPCRVARWTDGKVVATYREARQLPPAAQDPAAGDEPVTSDDGRTVQADGEQPWTRWDTGTGQAEVVVAGGPDRAMADTAIARLVEDLEATRGEAPSDVERWYAATPAVDLPAGAEHTRTTSVRLAVSGGGTVAYRIEVSGVGSFPSLLDDAGLDEELTAEVGPTLRRSVDPRETQGVVGASLTLQAEGADLTASFGGGTVEPGRRDEAPRASEHDARTLLLSLARVDRAGWDAFTALAPDGEPDPNAERGAPEPTDATTTAPPEPVATSTPDDGPGISSVPQVGDHGLTYEVPHLSSGVTSGELADLVLVVRNTGPDPAPLPWCTGGGTLADAIVPATQSSDPAAWQDPAAPTCEVPDLAPGGRATVRLDPWVADGTAVPLTPGPHRLEVDVGTHRLRFEVEVRAHVITCPTSIPVLLARYRDLTLAEARTSAIADDRSLVVIQSDGSAPVDGITWNHDCRRLRVGVDEGRVRYLAQG